MATKEIVFTQRGARDLQAMFRSMRQEAEQMGRAFGKAGRVTGRTARETVRTQGVTRKSMRDAEQAARRAARVQGRAAKTAADARIKEATRAARAEQRLRDRALRAELNDWKARQRIDTRHRHRMERMAATHARRRERIRRGQRSLFFDYTMGAYRGGGSMLRGAAGMLGIGGLAAIAGTGAYAFGSAAREGLALNDAARRLSRKGGGAVSAEALRKSVEQTTLQVKGVKAMDVMAGMERFVSKTGDVGAAQRFGRTFAEVGLATGTDIEAIGAAAADLFEKFDIKTIEDMSKAMATLAVQGKRGAFELEDAAAQFPKIAAVAASFGLTGMKGVATLGGLTQIAKRGAGGMAGEETATAVENMFAQLIKKSDVIKRKTGYSVFKDRGKTQANDIVDVLTGTIAGAKGNLKTLEDIFGTRGARAVKPMTIEYNRARAAAKGTEAEKDIAAMAALRAMITKAIDATGALEEIQRDLADAQQDASSRLTAAWESVKIQVSDKAVPALIGALERLGAFIDQTDFTGAGEAIAAMAKAAITAAELLGLIKPKGAKEFELEKTSVQLEAEEAGRMAKAKRATILAQATQRGKLVKGKFVPGELTEEEKSTVATLDEEIRLAEEKAAKAESQVASAKRFNVPLPGALGVTEEDRRRAGAMGPTMAMTPGYLSGGGGERGPMEQIANEALRQLAMQAEGVNEPLDAFSEAVRQATKVLANLGETGPKPTALNL